MSKNLSTTDVAILDLLQKDASRTSGEIATEVNMSQSPCWRRISRFEESGLVRGKVALLDRDQLGLDLVAFVNVGMSAAGHQHMQNFEQEVSQIPEVVECYTMAGEFDYLLKIVVRDIQSFETFIRRRLLTLPTVGKLVSHIAITEIKNTTVLPLGTQL